MATAADRFVSVADLDKNILTCKICQERFKNPKMLPCGHTFCQECLEKWAEENKGKELTCPNCRKAWQVPEGGIEKLLANYDVKSMVDFVFSSQTVDIGSDKELCEFCESKAATSACVEWRQRACDTCAKGHKRTKMTANHQIVSLEEYKASYENQQLANLKFNDCEKHPGSWLKYYCETCSTPICTDCTIIEHRIPEHQHVPLSEVALDTRNLMTETLRKIKEKVNYYKEKDNNIRRLKENLTNSKEQEILEVLTHAENLIKKIQKNGEDVVKIINTTYDVKTKILDSQQDQIKIAINNMESSFEDSQKLLEQGTDAALMSVHKQTQKKLKGLLNEDIQEFNYHQQYLSDPAIASDQQDNNKPVARNSFIKIVQPYNKVVCQLITCDIYGNEVKQGGAEVTAEVIRENGGKVASNITDHKNGTYDISFDSSYKQYFLSVSLFGQPVKDSPVKIDLQLLSPLPLEITYTTGGKGSGAGKFNCPSGVAVSEVGDIFVADRNNCRIQVFDLDGRYKRHFSVVCEGKKVMPSDVAFTRENHLVIIDYSGKQVCVCDTDGKLLKQLGKGQFEGPVGLAVNSKGNFHVTDWDGHCVKTFTPEGVLVRTLGSEKGSRKREFNNPRGVTVNSKDQIIVSDLGNQRIQVFDSSGRFLFLFRIYGGVYHTNEEKPNGVTVDQYDNIIVCDWGNHHIMMFSPKGNYIARVDDPADGVKWPWAIATIPGPPLKLFVIEANFQSDENHYKLIIMRVK